MNELIDYSVAFFVTMLGVLCVIGCVCLIKIVFYQDPNGSYDQMVQLLRYNGD